MKYYHDRSARSRVLRIGDRVKAKNFATGPKWLSGTVKTKTGPVSYEVELDDGRIIRRHIDHLYVCAPIDIESLVLPNPQPSLQKENTQKEYENGGCKMVDLEEMIKAQQIKMIKRLLENENLLWKPTMEAIIGISNLDLFLRSNFPVPKNTSNFYTAVLKSWKEFKYETFNSKEDILNQYLWYNEKLKITNKTIYLKSFDDCGIRKIADITNEDGSLKSYNDVCSTFNTATTNAALYAKVVKAIPNDWKELIKKREIYVIDNNCYANTNGDKTELQNMNQKSIYKALVIKKLDRSAAHKKIYSYL